MEDLRHMSSRLRHGQPMLQVLAEVVTEEWTHCEGIVHYYLTLLSNKEIMNARVGCLLKKNISLSLRIERNDKLQE